MFLKTLTLTFPFSLQCQKSSFRNLLFKRLESDYHSTSLETHLNWAVISSISLSTVFIICLHSSWNRPQGNSSRSLWSVSNLLEWFWSLIWTSIQSQWVSYDDRSLDHIVSWSWIFRLSASLHAFSQHFSQELAEESCSTLFDRSMWDFDPLRNHFDLLHC